MNYAYLSVNAFPVPVIARADHAGGPKFMNIYEFIWWITEYVWDCVVDPNGRPNCSICNTASCVSIFFVSLGNCVYLLLPMYLLLHMLIDVYVLIQWRRKVWYSEPWQATESDLRHCCGTVMMTRENELCQFVAQLDTQLDNVNDRLCLTQLCFQHLKINSTLSYFPIWFVFDIQLDYGHEQLMPLLHARCVN